MPENDNDSIPAFRSEKYQWLRSQASLDLMEIDEAVMQMGVLIQEAGECCALANEIRETEKDNLERVKARVAEYLRGEPYNGKHRSESMIDSQLPAYQEYKDAQARLSTARKDAALWATVIEALRAKSMQIRVAADLLNSGFLQKDYIIARRRKEIRTAGPKEEVKA